MDTYLRLPSSITPETGKGFIFYSMKKDWIEIELGQVCKYSKGKKPKILLTEYSNRTPYPYINIRAFEKGFFDHFTDGHKCNLCEDGDLLMVWDGARAGLTGKAKKGAVGSTLMKIEPQKGILKGYLFYFLLSLYKKLNTNPRGVGIPHVEPNLLWNSFFSIPDTPTQRAIVAKLDQLFSDLDNGIANLKAAKAKLEIYRQAVLKKAFEIDCQTVLLATVTDITGGVTKGKKLEGKESIELPYLRVANVQDGYLNLEIIKQIKVRPEDFDKYRLEYEDVLFTEGGDRDKLGRGTVWRNEIKDCIHQNHIFRARIIDRNLLNPYFLSYYAQSPAGKDFFYKNGKHTTNLASINKTILSSLTIPLPPILKQIQIIQELETRLSVCDKLSETIDQSLEKSEALRQSILKKAFEGKLLSEAELQACRQEPDWEPAQKLLARINEKETIKSPKQKSIKTSEKETTKPSGKRKA